jgi:hypothetical protein
MQDREFNAQKIVTRLFKSVDTGNWAMPHNLFAANVHTDFSSLTGEPAGPRTSEDVIANWARFLKGFDATHHQLGNFILSAEGQNMRVYCYCTNTYRIAQPDGQNEVWIVIGHYDFRLHEVESKWRIYELTFNFKFSFGNQDLPRQAREKGVV